MSHIEELSDLIPTSSTGRRPQTRRHHETGFESFEDPCHHERLCDPRHGDGRRLRLDEIFGD